MYWLAPISIEIRKIQTGKRSSTSRTKQLVLTAFFIAMATMFQTMSSIPGFGDLVRPLATTPIILAFFLSIRRGVAAFLITNLLLLMIHPPQAIIFTFFTGFIGVSIGLSFHLLRRRITLILFNSLALLISMTSMLYLFQIPILGSMISTTFQIFSLGFLYFFSFIYAWLCIDICTLLILKLIRYL